MDYLAENAPDKLEAQFRLWKNFLNGRNIEDIYKGVFEAIRKDPSKKKKPEPAHPPMRVREGAAIKTSKATYMRPKKISLEERKQRVKDKILAHLQRG